MHKEHLLEIMRGSTFWIAGDDPDRRPVKTGDLFDREIEKTKKRELEIDNERHKSALTIQARAVANKSGSVPANK